jgi:hypothetical protein
MVFEHSHFRCTKDSTNKEFTAEGDYFKYRFFISVLLSGSNLIGI